MHLACLRIVLATFLVVGALARQAVTVCGAETLELKFGHVGTPGSLFALSADEFAQRANLRLRGRATVVVYGASQLGDDTEVMQKIRLGTVDFALPSTVMSTLVAEFGLFEMPYIVKDREHMKRIKTEVFWPTLAPLAEKAGYKVLGVWENGFRQITNNVRPIVTPEDLKGLKLRVPKGKWRLKIFEDYGAAPIAMGFSEVYAALQAGVIDGQENPVTQIVSAKFQEVQKFLSLTDHVYTPAYFVVSPRRWESWSPEVRDALLETAREMESFVQETAAREDTSGLEKLKTAGIKVNVPDRPAFISASKPAYDQFSAEVPGGRELIERCQALAK
jgi:tripartite ATP-independent transporter DctP family solute receptor